MLEFERLIKDKVQDTCKVDIKAGYGWGIIRLDCEGEQLKEAIREIFGILQGAGFERYCFDTNTIIFYPRRL